MGTERSGSTEKRPGLRRDVRCRAESGLPARAGAVKLCAMPGLKDVRPACGKRSRFARPRPHVALLVETSLASGRDILRGIARYAREHEPWALYHEPRSLEETLPSWLRDWKGDGIIVRAQNDRIARAVQATGIPAVDVLGVAPASRLPLVHVDDRLIAATAAEHLVERGFHHFGFFGIEGENWSERRREYFQQALKAASSHFSAYELRRHARSRLSWEKQEDAIASWLVRLPKPVGIMVSSDQLGSRLLEACRRAGTEVPYEIAVVGVDNDETLCEVCHPPLSSVNAGHPLLGYEAASLLDRLMHKRPAPARPTLIQPQGVVTRKSTDVLATADRPVAAALKIIQEYACQGLTAADVVAQIPVSRSVLQRRFRKELGRSLQEEIIQARLKRARQLLAETDLPLIDVAERAGFRHQEYLGAIFKAKTGKTPAQYRREASLNRG
jgi:LacI family transcriptional regulator